MKVPLSQRSFIWLLLAAGGGALGAAVILYGYPFPPGSPSQIFVEQPEFLTWLFLIIVMTAVLALSVGPMWLSLRQLREYFRHNVLDITASTLLVLAVFIVPVFLARQISALPTAGLLYHQQKINVLLLFAATTIAPAIAGVFLVRAACLSMFASIQSSASEAADFELVKQHTHLRGLLQQYLSILGILVGLVTLTTGALRNVEIATGIPEEQFPVTAILIYGLYYTAVLALVYLPAYFALTEAGRRLRDHIYPIDSLQSLLEATEKRAKLDEVLQLSIKAEQSLRAGIAIFAPLLSSLIASLLGVNF